MKISLSAYYKERVKREGAVLETALALYREIEASNSPHIVCPLNQDGFPVPVSMEVYSAWEELGAAIRELKKMED